MHAIHPPIPRPLLVTVSAAMLTVLLVLALAARVGDVSFSSSSRASAAVAAPAKIEAVAAIHRPAWLANPLAPPFQQPLHQLWTLGDATR